MSGPLNTFRALAMLALFAMSGCIERPDESVLRPPAELARLMEQLNGASPGRIAEDARKGSQQLARRSARLTAPVLARAIRLGELQASRAGAQAVPKDIREMLAPHFARETLASARWTVGKGRLDVGSLVTEQFMEEGAVALNRQIVFSNERLTRNLWMWAHELAHVEQYRRLDVDGFAAAYIADWRKIEREANARANRVTAAIRKAAK